MIVAKDSMLFTNSWHHYGPISSWVVKFNGVFYGSIGYVLIVAVMFRRLSYFCQWYSPYICCYHGIAYWFCDYHLTNVTRGYLLSLPHYIKGDNKQCDETGMWHLQTHWSLEVLICISQMGHDWFEYLSRAIMSMQSQLMIWAVILLTLELPGDNWEISSSILYYVIWISKMSQNQWNLEKVGKISLSFSPALCTLSTKTGSCILHQSQILALYQYLK